MTNRDVAVQLVFDYIVLCTRAGKRGEIAGGVASHAAANALVDSIAPMLTDPQSPFNPALLPTGRRYDWPKHGTED